MTKILQLGMIGLDTSHCPAFADILHNAQGPYFIPGAHIAGAFPGGSDLFSLSKSRVEGFTTTLRDEYGVPIFASIEEMGGMDGYFLESVDGRQHLEQFRILAEFGKPVFIDKPLACSYADAREIMAIAKAKGVPVISSSSIRFGQGLPKPENADDTVHSCETYGPMAILDDYPSFYWYGIHSVDLLYSYMGAGCREVQVHHVDGMDLMVGTWEDGRIGAVHGGRRGSIGFGCTLFAESGTRFGTPNAEPPYYALMIEQLMPFFRTGTPPFAPEEALEVIAFLDAAEQSMLNGGKAVALPRG